MSTITVNCYMLTVCFYSESNPEPPVDYASTLPLNIIPPKYLNGISMPSLHDLRLGEKVLRCILVGEHLSGVQKVLGSILTSLEKQTKGN